MYLYSVVCRLEKMVALLMMNFAFSTENQSACNRLFSSLLTTILIVAKINLFRYSENCTKTELFFAACLHFISQNINKSYNLCFRGQFVKKILQYNKTQLLLGQKSVDIRDQKSV